MHSHSAMPAKRLVFDAARQARALPRLGPLWYGLTPASIYKRATAGTTSLSPAGQKSSPKCYQLPLSLEQLDELES